MLHIPLLHAFGEHHSVSPILLSSQRYEIIPSIYRLIDVNKPVQMLIRGPYVFFFLSPTGVSPEGTLGLPSVRVSVCPSGVVGWCECAG